MRDTSELGSVCGLCGPNRMWTFIITPIGSLFFTILFTFIDVTIRGDRAREPLVTFGFDKKSEKAPANIEEGAVKEVDDDFLEA